MASPIGKLAGILPAALVGAAALFAAPTPALAQLVGITQGMDPALYTINPTSGTVTDVGSVGDGGITALTVDGSFLLAGNENGDLYQINPGDGATTLLGSAIAGDTNQIQGLAVLNGDVYGLQLDNTSVLDLYNYTTDTLIGAADNNGIVGAQGLTVYDGALVTADAATAGGYLFSLDPGTAAATSLDTTGGMSPGLPLNGLTGLAAVGGTLYAVNNDSYTPDYAVYQVVPGTASVSNRIDLGGLRFGALAAAPPAVPEPGALWLLAPALGLLAAARRRPARNAAGLATILGLACFTLAPRAAQAQFAPAGNNPYTTPALNPTASLPQPPNNASATATNPLVTGKSLTLPPLGTQTNVGSLPLNMVLSPDGKYAVSSDMGFREFLVVVNTVTGAETSGLDFNGANPAGAGALTTNQEGLYYGLAFSPNKDTTGTYAGDYTLYAAQGNENTIAILKLDPTGTLIDTKVRFHGNTPSVPLPALLNGALDQELRLPAGTPLTFQQAFSVKPVDTPSGLTLDTNGYLYVANNDTALPYNPASISVYNTNVSPPIEVGRFTFPQTPAGTNYPFSLAVLPDGSKLFVGSERDAQLYVFSPSTTDGVVTLQPEGTIATGSHPLGLTLSADHTKLYVANAQSDTVSVVNTGTDAVTATVLLRPQGALSLPGVTPDGLALSPDGKTLYAAVADMNAVAEIDTTRNRLLGYIPVGWYPTAVVASANNTLLVTNAKGNYSRYPNPGYGSKLAASNPIPTYNENMIEGDIQTIPVQSAAQLAQDTAMTLANNKITATTDNPTFNPLAAIGLRAGKIKHVIYIVKENRTYDQILGDLKDAMGNPLGNGDASICLDVNGEQITPNLHALARRFVLLDNYYEGGEVSEDGWNWSNQGMANEFTVRNVPYNYSNRQDFTQTDFQGQNNGNIAAGFPPVSQTNPNFSLLYPAGAAPITDIAQNAGGYIWDDAQKTGLSYRNYGVDGSTGAQGVIPDNYPTHTGQTPGGEDLAGKTDLDFRHFDTNFPDSDAPYFYAYGRFPALPATGQPYTYPATQSATAQNPDPQNAQFNTTEYGHYNTPSRFSEFRREFSEMLANGTTAQPDAGVPAFMTMTLMSDHTQGNAAGGATNPRIHSAKSMIADDDFGVGQMVQLVSNSPIWDSTAIFVIEDDSQDGPDHVDCHRSICFVISPWIKQSAVDHTFYNTDSVLHTMEDLLGLPAMNQYDAIAPVISDWDTAPNNSAPYTASLPAVNVIEDLNPTMLALRKMNHSSAQYRLAMLCSKMDFRHPDAAPEDILNEAIWKSIKGWNSAVPAPVHRAQLVDFHAPAGSAKGKVVGGDDDDH